MKDLTVIRVLIADDHPLVREGLKKILKEESDMEIVAEAENSEELLQMMENRRVDVVVTDLSMPGKNALELLKDVSKVTPRVPVLILTMHPEERFAVRAIRLGAAGYLTKESAPIELVKAIRRVVTGSKYITPSVADKMAREYEPLGTKAPHELLSHREFEILCMIASGRSVKEIASDLNISVNTVHTYRSRVLEKMNARSSNELTQYAIRNNLIE